MSTEAALEYPELRGLDETPDDLPAFRMVDGVRVQDVSAGDVSSLAVGPSTLASVRYVLRRSNGYFIDASYGFDRFDTYAFRPGSGQVTRGFDTAVAGMHEGGRRRFVIPPDLGYVVGTRKGDPGPIPPDFGARRALAAHCKEPLVFEVVVVRVRSLDAAK